MRVILIVAMILAVMLIASCGDDVTNNYYRTDTGTILGTVSPVDSGIVRATADKTYEGKLTDEGTFRVDNLLPGTYTLEVLPANHTKRVFRTLVVREGTPITLSNITLSNYPYPIYKSDPVDNGSGYGGSSINLYVDEFLDLDELNHATHISPQPDAISWRHQTGYTYDYNDVYTSFSYFSLPIYRNGKAGLRLGTHYKVDIDSTVHTLDGEPLGKSIHFEFTTVPLSVSLILPYYSVSELVSIASFSPSLKFSQCINPDSVNKAIHFEPAIEGLWLPSAGNDYYIRCTDTPLNYFYRFYVTSTQPQADTKYKFIVSDKVALLEDVTFMTPDTVEFTTESYGVESVVPINGAYHVAADAEVRLSFNTRMDTVTVLPHFSVEMVNGGVVPGAVTWSIPERQILFTHPDAAFMSQAVYKVSVLKGSRTESGAFLENDFVSYFVVE